MIQKTPAEIVLIKKACEITRNALIFAKSLVKEGISTYDIDKSLEKFIIDSGGSPACLGYEGYPAATCISVNEMVVHGIPSKDIVLKNGDIVSIDIVVAYKGYHGDATRTYAVGEIDAEKEKLVAVTEECFFKGIENLRAGTPLFDIGYRVQKHAEAHGYGVIRSYTGHGIGKQMHEDPSVPNYGKAGTGVRLRAGTVLCIEPMIALGDYRVKLLDDEWSAVTVDGKCAAHYENTVVVREDGVEILTL